VTVVSRPRSTPDLAHRHQWAVDLVIYPIRNKIISWWDPASGLSRGLEMYQDENHKRRRVRIEFLGAAEKQR
jgi:hypothetical protein